MNRRKIIITAAVIAIPLLFVFYGFNPVVVSEGIHVSNRNIETVNFATPGQKIPVFANLTVPADALTFNVYVTMNSTYINGQTAKPSSLIIGLFSVNNSSYSLEKAGYYNPVKGYYDIDVNPISYSYKIPSTNPNGSPNFSKPITVNYTFHGKSYVVGIDPSLNGNIRDSTIHSVRVVYTYRRF